MACEICLILLMTSRAGSADATVGDTIICKAADTALLSWHASILTAALGTPAPRRPIEGKSNFWKYHLAMGILCKLFKRTVSPEVQSMSCRSLSETVCLQLLTLFYQNYIKAPTKTEWNYMDISDLKKNFGFLLSQILELEIPGQF